MMYKYTGNTNSNQNGYKYFSVPGTINFAYLFNEHKLNKELRHIAKYEYLVGLIYSEQLEQLTFVPISNTILRKVIRQELITRIKDNLFKMGLVECDYKMRFEIQNDRPVGIEPYGYRITEKYYVPHSTSTLPCSNTLPILHLEQSFFSKNINNKPDTGNSNTTIYNRDGYGFDADKLNKTRDAFFKKVVKAHHSRFNDLVNLPQKPEYKYIRENALRLEIDPLVYDWIDKQVALQMPLKPQQCQFINASGKLIIYIKKNRFLNAELAKDWKHHVTKIERGSYTFSCPATTNRVYYNVTSMPSELRKFLRYQGQPLVHLDYSNFQPFLLIKFLLEQYKDQLPADVIKYIELTSSGTFYAEVKTLIKESGITIKDEDSFKYDFFKRVFFSKAKRNDKYRKVFADTFPNVYAVIFEVKKNDYKKLSVDLQKLEAQIVINTILREIAEQYPASFVIPVHDALICEQCIAETVKALMLEKTTQIIGYTPDIKKELLKISN